jgi:hypothetical protein
MSTRVKHISGAPQSGKLLTFQLRNTSFVIYGRKKFYTIGLRWMKNGPASKDDAFYVNDVNMICGLA